MINIIANLRTFETSRSSPCEYETNTIQLTPMQDEFWELSDQLPSDPATPATSLKLLLRASSVIETTLELSFDTLRVSYI